MQLSKILVCIAGVSLSAAAFASAAPMMAASQTSAFDGFYAGAGIVGLNTSTDVRMGDDLTEAAALGDLDLEGTSSGNTAGGRLNFGYGHTLGSKGYVGAELAYRYAPTEKGYINPDPIDAFGNNVRFDGIAPEHDLALNFRAGYFFVPGAMMYALVGFNETKFNYTFTSQGLEAQYTKSSWMTGVTPGVGMEVQLADALTLDARYTYSMYDSATSSVSEEVPLFGPDTTAIKVSPSVNAVSLTLNYHFA